MSEMIFILKKRDVVNVKKRIYISDLFKEHYNDDDMVNVKKKHFNLWENWVSNSWDIANIEFVWGVGGGGWGVVCKVIFMSNPT